VVFALLRVGDSHIDLLGRHGLGENRRRWGEVGRPIRDGARSVSIPEVGVEVGVFREGLCMEVEGLNFVRDGAGGRPGHAHRDVERVARHRVEDGNGRTQARREEFLIDLESRAARRTEGGQQLCVRAEVKLADKDVGTTKGLLVDGVLRAVNEYKGVDTAIGTHVVEVSLGGHAMEPKHEGGSRCCMSPWGAGGESEGYERQQKNEQTASDACNFHDEAPFVRLSSYVTSYN
jgi:hypothetical protein